MTNSEEISKRREEEFDRIVHGFYESVENGVTPDEADLIARHPGFADELRSFFADVNNLLTIDRQQLNSGVRPEETLRTGPNAPTLAPDSRFQYIGTYRIVREISRGGMGIVFEAYQESLRRRVALKLILSGNFASDDLVQRFKSEAEAAARLDHPGIVPIFEIGQHEGLYYFSMGLVDGESVADRLRDEPLPPKEAAKLLAEVCDAVAYAHSHGVIHRDLKPGNVLIDKAGNPRVTDFGLAKQLDTDNELTPSGHVLGTPAYMSPEQAMGNTQATGVLADVYSLGATLYAMLTGHPPFQAASTIESLRQVIEREPLSPRLQNPRIPKDLETICLKCLRKETEQRYSSAQALAEDLRRFLSGQPIAARPTRRIERAVKWCKRKPAVASLSAVSIALLIMIPAVWGITSARSKERERENYAKALVESLSVANTADVERLILEISEYKQLATPLLRDIATSNNSSHTEKLHASLALVNDDPSQIEFLLQPLLAAGPDQASVIISFLESHKEQVKQRLWDAIETGSVGQRIRAAAALAQYDVTDERWKLEREDIVTALLSVPAAESDEWVEMLRPVGAILADPLELRFRDSNENRSSERPIIAAALSVFLKDKPKSLTLLMLLADNEREFQPLLSALRSHPKTVIPELQTLVVQSLPEGIDSADRDAFWKRQANAAVCLLELGETASVWPLFQQTPDPSLRSFIIDRLARLGGNPTELASRIMTESEPSSRYAMILALGQFDPQNLASEQRQTLIEQLTRLYREDPDPGVHGSASWTLRRWGIPLPELPTGTMPELVNKQSQEVAATIEDIQRQIAAAEEELPVRLTVFEKQLRDQTLWSADSLLEGLVAHFPFDDTSGKEAINAVDDEQGGQYAGPHAPQYSPGVHGNAVHLDGKGEHFVCGDAFSAERTDSFSYGCWILSEDVSRKCVLIDKTDAEQNWRGLDLHLYGRQIGVNLIHRGGRERQQYNKLSVRSSTNAVSVGKWHHVMMTYDGRSNSAAVKLYVNGRNAAAYTIVDSLSASIVNGVALKIGMRQKILPFRGWIDDVRFYNRCLDKEEVRELYGLGLASLACIPRETRTPEQQALLEAAYRQQDERMRSLNAAFDQELPKLIGDTLWFVNSQGQTFTVINGPVEFQMGENTAIQETKKKVTLAHSFAVATHEVTLKEFQTFRSDHKYDARNTPQPNTPVTMVSWYDAVAYCNWLNEQEGIPKDQWCYEPNNKGEYAEGVKIASDFLSRTGYRLPTDEEWEFMCRAKTTSTYGFGEAVELLRKYSWYKDNSDSHLRPVGAKMPNRFGVFDMHGNASEWCHSLMSSPMGQADLEARDSDLRLLRSGGFLWQPLLVSSASQMSNIRGRLGVRVNGNSVRPARTLNDGSNYWEEMFDAYYQNERWDDVCRVYRAADQTQITLNDLDAYCPRCWKFAIALAHVGETQRAHSAYEGLVSKLNGVTQQELGELHDRLAKSLGLLPPLDQFSPWLSKDAFRQVNHAMISRYQRPPMCAEGRTIEGEVRVRGKFGPPCGVRWWFEGRPLNEEEYRAQLDNHQRLGNREVWHHEFLDGEGKTLHLAIFQKWPSFDGSGRIEAEAFARHNTGTGRAFAQTNMANFHGGSWTGNTQLLWIEQKKDDRLQLGFEVSKEADYEILTVLTKASNFGIVSIELDGVLLVADVDLFAEEVSNSHAKTLGVHHLKTGPHRIEVVVQGQNPLAHDCAFGLDYVRLLMRATSKTSGEKHIQIAP